MTFQAYIDNIKAKTGKTPDDFKALAARKGLLKPGVKAGEIVAWLKADFDLAMAMQWPSTRRSSPTSRRSRPLDRRYASMPSAAMTVLMSLSPRPERPSSSSVSFESVGANLAT